MIVLARAYGRWRAFYQYDDAERERRAFNRMPKKSAFPFTVSPRPEKCMASADIAKMDFLVFFFFFPKVRIHT